jgi:dienelactone hydrolase
MIYDVFGLFIQTIRGADILASGFPSDSGDKAGDYQVFMPDFFGDNPSDITTFPPKTPAQVKFTTAFMTGPAAPNRTVPLIAPIMEELKRAHPEIESWAVLGFCWGGKIAALVSQEGSLFKASGQCHPSLIDTEDAKKVRIPMVVLPSMDEDTEVCLLFTFKIVGATLMVY